MAVLITGIARHSLGEALVPLLAAYVRSSVIAVDIEPNPTLEAVVHVNVDLNPFNYQTGLEGFRAKLVAELSAALAQLGQNYFSHVIQCAGAYWSGSFVESSPEMRARIFGVNTLGHLEVLHAAMAINVANGADNAAVLSHIEVGS